MAGPEAGGKSVCEREMFEGASQTRPNVSMNTMYHKSYKNSSGSGFRVWGSWLGVGRLGSVVWGLSFVAGWAYCINNNITGRITGLKYLF